MHKGNALAYRATLAVRRFPLLLDIRDAYDHQSACRELAIAAAQDSCEVLVEERATTTYGTTILGDQMRGLQAPEFARISKV